MAGNPQSDVFLLGGNGFIGTALSDRLRGEGRRVTVLDPMPPRDPSHREYWIPGKLEDTQLCEKVLRPGMTVVHLACSSLPEPSNRDPHGDLASNLLPTVLWLGACAEAGVSKVIFMSSGGTVYGIPQTTPIREDHPTDPICSYGIGKLAVEKYLALYCHLSGLPSFVLRASNVYGEGKDPFGKQGAINVFLGKVARKETISVWGDGKIVRDYLYVSDLVDLIARCVNGGSSDESHTCNAGSGKGHSLREILTVIKEVTGEEPRVDWLEGRKDDVPTNVLDITRARSRFDWSPRVTLHDGIRKTWEWIRGSGYAR